MHFTELRMWYLVTDFPTNHVCSVRVGIESIKVKTQSSRDVSMEIYMNVKQKTVAIYYFKMYGKVLH